MEDNQTGTPKNIDQFNTEESDHDCRIRAGYESLPDDDNNENIGQPKRKAKKRLKPLPSEFVKILNGKEDKYGVTAAFTAKKSQKKTTGQKRPLHERLQNKNPDTNSDPPPALRPRVQAKKKQVFTANMRKLPLSSENEQLPKKVKPKRQSRAKSASKVNFLKENKIKTLRTSVSDIFGQKSVYVMKSHISGHSMRAASASPSQSQSRSNSQKKFKSMHSVSFQEPNQSSNYHMNYNNDENIPRDADVESLKSEFEGSTQQKSKHSLSQIFPMESNSIVQKIKRRLSSSSVNSAKKSRSSTSDFQTRKDTRSRSVSPDQILVEKFSTTSTRVSRPPSRTSVASTVSSSLQHSPRRVESTKSFRKRKSFKNKIKPRQILLSMFRLPDKNKKQPTTTPKTKEKERNNPNKENEKRGTQNKESAATAGKKSVSKTGSEQTLKSSSSKSIKEGKSGKETNKKTVRYEPEKTNIFKTWLAKLKKLLGQFKQKSSDPSDSQKRENPFRKNKEKHGTENKEPGTSVKDTSSKTGSEQSLKSATSTDIKEGKSDKATTKKTVKDEAEKKDNFKTWFAKFKRKILDQFKQKNSDSTESHKPSPTTDKTRTHPFRISMKKHVTDKKEPAGTSGNKPDSKPGSEHTLKSVSSKSIAEGQSAKPSTTKTVHYRPETKKPSKTGFGKFNNQLFGQFKKKKSDPADSQKPAPITDQIRAHAYRNNNIKIVARKQGKEKTVDQKMKIIAPLPFPRVHGFTQPVLAILKCGRLKKKEEEFEKEKNKLKKKSKHKSKLDASDSKATTVETVETVNNSMSTTETKVVTKSKSVKKGKHSKKKTENGDDDDSEDDDDNGDEKITEIVTTTIVKTRTESEPNCPYVIDTDKETHEKKCCCQFLKPLPRSPRDTFRNNPGFPHLYPAPGYRHRWSYDLKLRVLQRLEEERQRLCAEQRGLPYNGPPPQYRDIFTESPVEERCCCCDVHKKAKRKLLDMNGLEMSKADPHLYPTVTAFKHFFENRFLAKINKKKELETLRKKCEKEFPEIEPLKKEKKTKSCLCRGVLLSEEEQDKEAKIKEIVEKMATICTCLDDCDCKAALQAKEPNLNPYEEREACCCIRNLPIEDFDCNAGDPHRMPTVAAFKHGYEYGRMKRKRIANRKNIYDETLRNGTPEEIKAARVSLLKQIAEDGTEEEQEEARASLEIEETEVIVETKITQKECKCPEIQEIVVMIEDSECGEEQEMYTAYEICGYEQMSPGMEECMLPYMPQYQEGIEDWHTDAYVEEPVENEAEPIQLLGVKTLQTQTPSGEHLLTQDPRKTTETQTPRTSHTQTENTLETQTPATKETTETSMTASADLETKKSKTDLETDKSTEHLKTKEDATSIKSQDIESKTNEKPEDTQTTHTVEEKTKNDAEKSNENLKTCADVEKKKRRKKLACKKRTEHSLKLLKAERFMYKCFQPPKCVIKPRCPCLPEKKPRPKCTNKPEKPKCESCGKAIREKQKKMENESDAGDEDEECHCTCVGKKIPKPKRKPSCKTACDCFLKSLRQPKGYSLKKRRSKRKYACSCACEEDENTNDEAWIPDDEIYYPPPEPEPQYQYCDNSLPALPEKEICNFPPQQFSCICPQNYNFPDIGMICAPPTKQNAPCFDMQNGCLQNFGQQESQTSFRLVFIDEDQASSSESELESNSEPGSTSTLSSYDKKELRKRRKSKKQAERIPCKCKKPTENVPDRYNNRAEKIPCRC